MVRALIALLRCALVFPALFVNAVVASAHCVVQIDRVDYPIKAGVPHAFLPRAAVYANAEFSNVYLTEDVPVIRPAKNPNSTPFYYPRNIWSGQDYGRNNNLGLWTNESVGCVRCILIRYIYLFEVRIVRNITSVSEFPHPPKISCVGIPPVFQDDIPAPKIDPPHGVTDWLESQVRQDICSQLTFCRLLHVSHLSGRYISTTLGRMGGIDSTFRSGLPVICRLNGGISGRASINRRQSQSREGHNPDEDLYSIQIYRIFRRFRHMPLLTQIGLFMVLGIIAVGVGPIGVSRLWPVKGDNRQLYSGILYSAFGAISLALIFGIIFFG